MQQPFGQLSFEDLSRPASPPSPSNPPRPHNSPDALSYLLERSPRRKSSIHISVLPDLTVRVVAPMRLAKAKIDGLLREREAWILRQRDRMQAAQLKRVDRQWVTGERLPFLDDPLELRIRPVAGQKMVRAVRKDSWLDVWVPAGMENTEPIKRVVHKWYAIQAQQVFAQRALHYGSRMQLMPTRVLVRNQSSRWGSCASDGSLRLCWRLILAPLRVLDYVMVHELSHIRHPHHQPPFWACVESIIPNYKELRAELNRDGESYRL
jgi:predicted metal-dependent hydrolase